jgi:hypothetical protein
MSHPYQISEAVTTLPLRTMRSKSILQARGQAVERAVERCLAKSIKDTGYRVFDKTFVEINQGIPRVRQKPSNFTLPLLSPPSLVASHERLKGSTHL